MSKRPLFPVLEQLRMAFATALALSYTWMIFVYFYSLPAWQNIIPAKELLVTFAYGCSTALLESVGLVGILLIISRLLPREWFFEHFAIQASATALWLAPWQILIRTRFIYWATFSYSQVLPILLLLLVSVIYVNFVVQRYTPLAQLISQIADRAVIFIPLYLPLGLIGLITVIVRNLI